MRFDEFTEKHAIPAYAVDRFSGFVVQVAVPRGWDPFDSAVGLRVWACRHDPHIETFCANAVLTMHRVPTALEPADVFAMLAEQQLQSVSKCCELDRELGTAGSSPGVQGRLAMEIPHEFGTIESVSHSRIISVEQQTFIAQLTTTALQNSPVDRAPMWLAVHGGAPVADAISTNHHRNFERRDHR